MTLNMCRSHWCFLRFLGVMEDLAYMHNENCICSTANMEEGARNLLGRLNSTQDALKRKASLPYHGEKRESMVELNHSPSPPVSTLPVLGNRVSKVRKLLCDSLALGIRVQLLCLSLLELCDVDSIHNCNVEEDGNAGNLIAESSDTYALPKLVAEE